MIIGGATLFATKKRSVDPDLNDEKRARLELRKLYFSNATDEVIDKLEAQAQVVTLDDLRLLARKSNEEIAETLQKWYHVGALPVWLGRIVAQTKYRENLVSWFRSELRLRIDRARRSEG
jgi:hypothetical protein